MIRSGKTLFITVLVLASYIFLASPYLASEKFSPEPHNHYQFLTAGFLSGHLSLSLQPLPELLALKNPYDPLQNVKYRLHDATLYKEKYYLYFGPLPIVTYYLPFKLITGLYPTPTSAVLIYLSMGFMIGFYLLIQIRQRYLPNISDIKLYLAGLLFGLSTNMPFLLTRPSFYENAISSTYCFTMLALFFLYKLLHEFRLRNIILFSSSLTLTIAGRPHFILIFFPIFIAIALYSYTFHRSISWPRLLIALFTPLLIVGTILAIYNYLRFDSLWEFGQNYQLAGVNMRECSIFSLQFYHNMASGFYHYMVQPYAIYPMFPYIHYPNFTVLPKDTPYYYEYSLGLLCTTPIIAFVLGLPGLLEFNFKNNRAHFEPLLWFILFTSLIPLIILLFLISLSASTQRYESDFAPYFVFLAILAWWLFNHCQLKPFLLKLFNTLFFIGSIISLYIGFTLGINDWLQLSSRFYIHNNFIILTPEKLIVLFITLIAAYFIILPQILFFLRNAKKASD